MSLLVGIGNKARSGKDTLASYIAQRMPEACRVFGFSDDLKAMARGHGMTTKNPAFLQQLGAALRSLDPDYWINKLALRIAEAKPAVALISDMRFPNEYEWIKATGGLVVRITRTIEAGRSYQDPTRDPYHESETALDEYEFHHDFRIRSGDFGALQAAADRVVYAIGERLR